MRTAILALILSLVASEATAGVFCRARARKFVAVNASSVQFAHDVQFAPTFVSFVPSQVLLNGQVTTYGAPQAFSYSYQGAYQQAPQLQQLVPQGSPEERLDRIERMLIKALGKDALEGE